LPRIVAVEEGSFHDGTLAAYKIPGFVEFRDDLSKTSTGKILHRTLANSSISLQLRVRTWSISIAITE
jgi:acyl-CoA synthetase (AMP-forming)/AMP-acid ligase II